MYTDQQATTFAKKLHQLYRETPTPEGKVSSITSWDRLPEEMRERMRERARWILNCVAWQVDRGSLKKTLEDLTRRLCEPFPVKDDR